MITQILSETNNAAKNQNMKQVSANLNQLANLNSQQFQNQRNIPQKISNTFDVIRNAVRQNPSQIANLNIANNIIQVAKKINNQQIKKQAAQVAQSIRRSEIRQQNKQIQKAIQAIQVQKQLGIDSKQILPSVTLQTNITPLQQSMQQYQPILKSSFQMIKPSQIPSTMKVLQQYVKLKDYQPVGQTSYSLGSSFVGVKPIKIGGQTKYIPFQKNTITNTSIPNLPVQLQYYANRTINSWNHYVQDESKLVQFVGKVNTQQKRLQFVQKQFKGLNRYTFAAQFLASLTFYYVLIPMQRFSRKISKYANTQTQFYINYQIGYLPKQNPILIKTQQAKKLAQILLNKGQQKFPITTDLQIKVIEYLKSLKNKLNQQLIKKAIAYSQNRQNQAQAFFDGYGLTKSNTTKLLLYQNIQTVKKKKFILNTGAVNNQFMSIVTKITSQDSIVKSKSWTNSWGQQSIYCHDYIWQKQFY